MKGPHLFDTMEGGRREIIPREIGKKRGDGSPETHIPAFNGTTEISSSRMVVMMKKKFVGIRSSWSFSECFPEKDL